jgi:hypothetical protein
MPSDERVRAAADQPAHSWVRADHHRPQVPVTSQIYRTLLLRGLGAAEAANLTAYIVGIRVGDHGWKVSEINHLLFLRTRSARLDPGHDVSGDRDGTVATGPVMDGAAPS